MKYLADKKKSSSGKGIKVIQVNVIDILLAENSKSWLFDTGSVAHICNTRHGLRRVRKLNRKVMMRVGNGDGITAQAVSVMSLKLPSGFILELNNCYYVPKLFKDIISGSCLISDGYSYSQKTMVVRYIIRICFMGMHPLLVVYS